MTIEELNLEPVAKNAAKIIHSKYPHLQFTSGRRTIFLKISRHLTGKAFDIRSVTANAAAIKADILALPGLHRFLDKEGGLVRWHAQFQ